MIETSRLRLRPPTVEDFARYLPIYTTPEDPANPVQLVFGPEDCWYRLLRSVGHWTHFKYGLFLIEARGSGELLGEAGFAHFHRGHGPQFDQFPEGAWKISRQHRRQGIATEAMIAAAQWLDEHVCPARTVCMIHPLNAPSLSVAARLGFHEFERSAYKGEPAILMQRFRV